MNSEVRHMAAFRYGTCNYRIGFRKNLRRELAMIAFKKILFPTDFSPNADRALAHAIRLADVDGGEEIVQHVVSNYFDKHPHWATLFDLHEMQKQMDGYIDAHMTKILPKSTGNVRI